MSDDPKPPRIVERDRRRFTPEGEPRRPPATDDAASPAPPGSSAPAQESPPPADPVPESSPPRSSQEAPARDEVAAPAPQSDPRLQQLVFLLLHHADLVVRAAEEAAPPVEEGLDVADAAGAADAAEGAPPPAAGPEVLEGLQSVIGILEMLEEKTRSRLAEDDSRMLSRILYQMRMDYIARVGPPGVPGAGAGS